MLSSGCNVSSALVNQLSTVDKCRCSIALSCWALSRPEVWDHKTLMSIATGVITSRVSLCSEFGEATLQPQPCLLVLDDQFFVERLVIQYVVLAVHDPHRIRGDFIDNHYLAVDKADLDLHVDQSEPFVGQI